MLDALLEEPADPEDEGPLPAGDVDSLVAGLKRRYRARITGEQPGVTRTCLRSWSHALQRP